jgi:hypothetical protein
MAARGGNVLVLARLASLQLGLDINKVDTWGFTPLDHAVDAEQWPCAALLLAMGGELQLRIRALTCILPTFISIMSQ